MEELKRVQTDMKNGPMNGPTLKASNEKDGSSEEDRKACVQILKEIKWSPVRVTCENKKIIIIDGVIAAGKSTLVQSLTQYLQTQINPKTKNPYKVASVLEPVEQWRKFNILQRFYDDQKKYTFELQMCTFITRIQSIIEELERNQNDFDVMILERSILTDRYMFFELLKSQQSTGTVQIYEYSWNIWKQLMPFDLEKALFVYLRTDLDCSMKRLEERGRPEEVEHSISSPVSPKDLNSPKGVDSPQGAIKTPKEAPTHIPGGLQEDSKSKVSISKTNSPTKIKPKSFPWIFFGMIGILFGALLSTPKFYHTFQNLSLTVQLLLVGSIALLDYLCVYILFYLPMMNTTNQPQNPKKKKNTGVGGVTHAYQQQLIGVHDVFYGLSSLKISPSVSSTPSASEESTLETEPKTPISHSQMTIIPDAYTKTNFKDIHSKEFLELFTKFIQPLLSS